jgi:hypothetical protein
LTKARRFADDPVARFTRQRRPFIEEHLSPPATKLGGGNLSRCCRRGPECFALRYSSFEFSVTAPKKSENADIRLSALGEKIMKVTTLILALLALALGTGTAMVVSVQTQPVVTCGSPNC